MRGQAQLDGHTKLLPSLKGCRGWLLANPLVSPLFLHCAGKLNWVVNTKLLPSLKGCRGWGSREMEEARLQELQVRRGGGMMESVG